MGESRQSYSSEEEYWLNRKKLRPKIWQSTCSIENATQDKYKNILGSRPIVLLQRLPKNVLADSNGQTSKYCEQKIDTKNLAKDSLSDGQWNKPDLLLYNAKVVLTRLSKNEIRLAIIGRSTEELNKVEIAPKCNYSLKKGINDCTLPKKESSVLCVNKSDYESTFGKKAIVQYNKNSNIYNVPNEFEASTTKILKRKGENNRHNFNKKQKLNKDENIIANKSKGKIKCTDITMISQQSQIFEEIDTTEIDKKERDLNQNCIHSMVLRSGNLVNEENIPFNYFNFEKQEQEYTLSDTQKLIREEKKTDAHNMTHDIMQQSLETATLLKQTHTENNEIVSNEAVERVNSWLDNCRIKPSISAIEICSNNNNVIETNADRTISQLTNAAVNKITQTENNENIPPDIAEKKLNNEQGISNSIEQKKMETLRSVAKPECDSLQKKTWNLTEATSVTYKSPIQNEHLFSDEVNSSSTRTEDDKDEDIDCISLFADSALMEEYNDPIVSVKNEKVYNYLHSDKAYIMSNNVIDNYYERTTYEFNKLYNSHSSENSQNITKQNKESLKLPQNTTQNIIKDNTNYEIQNGNYKRKYDHSTPSIKFNQNSQLNKTTNRQTPDITNNIINAKSLLLTKFLQKSQIDKTETRHRFDIISTIFRGYCYKIINFGVCKNENCCFSHAFLPFMLYLYKKDEQFLFTIIDELGSYKYVTFLSKFYTYLLSEKNDIIYVLKMCKKLYQHNILTHKMGSDTITMLLNNNFPIITIISQLETIVSNSDSEFVNWILKIIDKLVIYYIRNGKYWNIIKSSLITIEDINPKIIDNILEGYIATEKYIEDVHENIRNKLNDYTKLNQQLLLVIDNKLRTLQDTRKVQNDQVSKETALTQSHASTVNDMPITSSPKVCLDTFLKTNSSDNNNNVKSENSPYRLHSIDDLPKPYSRHSREKFWKFYIKLRSLQEGLMHNDYDHVMEILNSVKEKEKTVFTRACYRILCNEIQYSQYQLNNLLLNAVQNGATAIFYEILFKVSIHILNDLARNECWVLAFKLLKNIDIMLQSHIYFFKLDAATILLFAEIYLANRQPIQAFTLIKQNKIICTNRHEWEVQSTARDDYVRTQIMALLLDTLCDTSSSYAFYIFEFLLLDQSSNYYPVDLTRAANKLVSTFSLKKDYEMIIDIGKLINKYDFVLSTITYRALIATLVHVDITLAKQLYQRAIGLGIYSKLQFHPVPYIIVKSDWTSEEMYLAIINLMYHLSTNIGHAIDRIKPSQISVYLYFEIMPSEKQLVSDEMYEERDNEINECIKRMSTLLGKEFDPPVWLITKNRSKLQKFNSRSILRHLQSKHTEYFI
ncbi:uncharacterized protein LOC143343955 isoform X2 [Colletes latitarsis]|uniref:uncharacterized protein LOC143343955 isoform X2 n=1 Tax=Colletes latitarsis TaxID=2605962 RepID=UPI004036A6DE